MKLTAAVTVLSLLGRLVLMVQAFPPEVKENPTPTIQWQDGFVPVFDAAAYPRVAELADGTLLAGFDHIFEGDRAIGFVRSTDGGKTWNGYSQATRHPRQEDLANAFPLQLSDGTVLVAFRHHTVDRAIYRLEVCASSDQGKSWKFRGTIATGSVGLWEPFLLELPDKTLQAYYASEEGIKPDQRIEMRSSGDGGKTWGRPITVARKRGSRDGMPGVVRRRDGTLFAVFEASDLAPYRFVIRAVRSKDGGKNWSPARELVYKPANPVRARWAAGAPTVVQFRKGWLLVSFQTDEDVAYKRGDPRRDPSAPSYNYLHFATFKCVSSSDGGRTWQAHVRLAGTVNEPSLWNALYVPRSGNVLALAGFKGKIWSRAGVVKQE